MTDGIRTRRVLNEFGVDVKVRVKSDAQAALSNAAKLGPGRMRHLMTSATFVKDAVRRRMVILEKVGTDANIADPMTKHLAREKHEGFLGGLGIFPAEQVVPKTYKIQKLEKLNVLNDITLVQQDTVEGEENIIAAVCGIEDEKKDPVESGNYDYYFYIVLMCAAMGIVRTMVDLWWLMKRTFYPQEAANNPQEVANRVENYNMEDYDLPAEVEADEYTICRDLEAGWKDNNDEESRDIDYASLVRRRDTSKDAASTPVLYTQLLLPPLCCLPTSPRTRRPTR